MAPIWRRAASVLSLACAGALALNLNGAGYTVADAGKRELLQDVVGGGQPPRARHDAHGT